MLGRQVPAGLVARSLMPSALLRGRLHALAPVYQSDCHEQLCRCKQLWGKGLASQCETSTLRSLLGCTLMIQLLPPQTLPAHRPGPQAPPGCTTRRGRCSLGTCGTGVRPAAPSPSQLQKRRLERMAARTVALPRDDAIAGLDAHQQMPSRCRCTSVLSGQPRLINWKAEILNALL